MIYHNGRPAGQVWHNGKRVREVWHMGKRIFPTRNPAFLGQEAFFEVFEPYNGGRIFTKPSTDTLTGKANVSDSNLVSVSAIASGDFDVNISASGRTLLDVSGGLGQVKGYAYGTNKTMLMNSEILGPGPHIIHASAYRTSSGTFRLTVLVDNVMVIDEQSSASDTVLTAPGQVDVWMNGTVSAAGIRSISAGTLKAEAEKRNVRDYVVFTTITKDTAMMSQISGGESTAWLIGGGEKGQAGDLRGLFKKGYNGRDAPIYQVPSVPFGSTVTIGKGSTKYGTMGTPTVFGQYSSDMSTTRNTTLTEWGSTFNASQYGTGGEGGLGLSYINPVPDWNGDPGADGALVLARRWP